MLRPKKLWYYLVTVLAFCALALSQNQTQSAPEASSPKSSSPAIPVPQPVSAASPKTVAEDEPKPAPASKTVQSGASPQVGHLPTPEIPASLQDSEPQLDSGDSLAAAAAQAKAQKGRAKKVVTDENIEAGIGPLPRLKENEAENGEEVIAAIAAYKANHTADDTEQVVRRWYEEYDEELKDAINANLEIRNTRAANLKNGYDLCQDPQQYRDYEDYQRCQERWMAENRGARNDQVAIARNSQWIVRLQHSMTNIRNGLFMMGLRYDWFKVRTTNGIDRF